MGSGWKREFLGEGWEHFDLSCWGILLLLNISKSKVKGIVKNIEVQFQNGNGGLRIGMASHPSAQNAEEWGTPLLYAI